MVKRVRGGARSASQYPILLEVIALHYVRIRELRRASKLTQQQMADQLNMHKTTYTRYECGRREVPLGVAVLLANFHQVSLDYLAGLKDDR